METTHLKDLKPDPKNARKHTPRNVGTIVDALHEVGAGRSIVIDENNIVLAGNATIEAAAEAGIEKVQVVDADGETIIAVRRSNLTPQQKTRLALFDNRAAELAEWDADVLAELVETKELEGMFSDKELAEILSQTGVEPKDAEPQIDKAEELKQKWGTETGQLWVIGNHRLLVGDATNKADVGRLLANSKPDAVVTDPPYGVGVQYDEFEDSQENALELIKKFMPVLLSLGCPVALTSGHRLMWDYPRPAWVMAWIHPAGMGNNAWGFTQFHPILVYGKCPYLAKGLGGRPDSIVMAVDREGQDVHPTSKPLEVWKWLVERLSPEKGQLIFEPFSGSGTTLVAAENLNRKCYAMEISPAYVAVCLERMTTAFPHLKIEKVDQARAA